MLTCQDQGRELLACLQSIEPQIGPEGEIIIVDGGSKDLITLEILAWCRASGLEILRTGAVGEVKAREIGMRRARGSIVWALGADQAGQESYLRTAVEILDSDSDISFVTCGLHDVRTGFVWTPESPDLPGLSGALASRLR